MEWTEIMARRDRVAELLRPHLGRQAARERANDIVQALVFDEEDPSATALRMLDQDLEPRTAEVVAYQLGRAWRGPIPLAHGDNGTSSSVREVPVVGVAASGPPAPSGLVRPRRRRRETLIIGLWN